METVTGEKDRISELPYELLVKIISMLPMTEDASVTRFVSRRWQFLWTKTDNVTLLNHYADLNLAFISFVDYVLAHRDPSAKIRKFYFRSTYYDGYYEHIEKWLSYLVENNVEHVILDIDTNYGKRYILPQPFCTCSSLVTLDMTDCDFDEGAVISWKSLKTLNYSWPYESDAEKFMKLLFGCPALETLQLTDDIGFSPLKIKNSNLKTLRLYWCGRGRPLEIFAPYLHHLDIIEFMNEAKCMLLNVSSLVSARLLVSYGLCESQNPDDSCSDYHHASWICIQDDLQKLSHVMELTIVGSFAEAMFMLQLDGVQLPEMKCKRLTLDLDIPKYNLFGLAGLLQASPHTETLTIDVKYDVYDYFRCHTELSYLQKGDDIGLGRWISNFAFSNVRSVNIIWSSQLCWTEYQYDKLFELSEFLLKNAKVLEKFVIITRKGSNCCSTSCVSPYFSPLIEKLSGVPKPSSNVKMIFKESID